MAAYTHAAISIWNVFSGVVDYAALPTLMAVYGVDDIDIVITLLVEIRRSQTEKSRKARSGEDYL